MCWLTARILGDSLEKIMYRMVILHMKKVVLSCGKCGSRNYSLAMKNDATKRLEIKKFCSFCNEHTIHKQTL